MAATDVIGEIVRRLEEVKAQDWSIQDKGMLLAAVRLQLASSEREKVAKARIAEIGAEPEMEPEKGEKRHVIRIKGAVS